MAVRTLFLSLAIVLSTLPVSAQESQARARMPPREEEAGVAVGDAVAETRAAGGAPARRIAPVPLTPMELQQALENARPEVRQCLQGHRPGTSVTVRARIDVQRRLTVRVVARPRDPQVDACVDLAVRRWAQPLAARWVQRTVTGSIRESIDVAIPPPPPPPRPPPPPPGGQYDESQVHAALDAMRTSILECVTDLAPGTPGSITLRVTVHPDGSMTLVGVGLPSGVRGPGALGCLSSRVGFLRVGPPPGERMVVHTLELGGR